MGEIKKQIDKIWIDLDKKTSSKLEFIANNTQNQIISLLYKINNDLKSPKIDKEGSDIIKNIAKEKLKKAIKYTKKQIKKHNQKAEKQSQPKMTEVRRKFLDKQMKKKENKKDKNLSGNAYAQQLAEYEYLQQFNNLKIARLQAKKSIGQKLSEKEKTELIKLYEKQYQNMFSKD